MNDLLYSLYFILHYFIYIFYMFDAIKCIFDTLFSYKL